MSSTNDIILERLRRGPALASELANLTGLHHQRGSDDSRLPLGGCELPCNRDTVSTAIRRLNDRGFEIVNLRPVGGRSVAMYRLMHEPGEARECCVLGCHTHLRASNHTHYCWPHLVEEACRLRFVAIDSLIADLEADLAQQDLELAVAL